MDILSYEDNAVLLRILQQAFEPLGTTDQFLVVGIGKENRAMVLHLTTPDSRDIETVKLLRALGNGIQGDSGFTLEF